MIEGRLFRIFPCANRFYPGAFWILASASSILPRFSSILLHSSITNPKGEAYLKSKLHKRESMSRARFLRRAIRKPALLSSPLCPLFCPCFNPPLCPSFCPLLCPPISPPLSPLLCPPFCPLFLLRRYTPFCIFAVNSCSAIFFS